ncbi:MAG: SCP2 sterol-binding domain-containing protein [Candidatus Helarchaeota archaeon]
MENINIKDIIQIKTLLYSNMVAFELISEEDEMVQEEFNKFDAVIQWKIGDLIFGYLTIKNSKPKLKMNAIHDNPTVTITISDMKAAKMLLKGKTDASRLFFKGKIQIDGDLKEGLKIFTASELLEDYIATFKSMK